MPHVAVITDSTAYLPDEIIKDYRITITPLSIIWEEKNYRDGVDIQPGEFYKRLANSKGLPTTSQVTLLAMKNTFENLLEQGYDVIGIFISSKFSGTVQSAIQAREMIPGATGKIAIIDSLSTTMAMGWPVLTTARAAQAGENLDACRKIAEAARDHSGVLFVVETLEYLRRGGRIGGAQALLGTLLNIKPVLEMRQGQIEPVERIRTKTKATNVFWSWRLNGLVIRSRLGWQQFTLMQKRKPLPLNLTPLKPSAAHSVLSSAAMPDPALSH